MYTLLQKKRNFSEPIFPGNPGSLTLTPVVIFSHNPNLFAYMSFWAHDKIAQIPLQLMKTWYFFQMVLFFWSRVYGIESLGIFFNSAVFQDMF